MSQKLSSQELLAHVKGEVKEMSMEELKGKLDSITTNFQTQNRVGIGWNVYALIKK